MFLPEKKRANARSDTPRDIPLITD